MTLDPRISVYLNLATVVLTALLGYTSTFTDLFGQHASGLIMGAFLISLGIVNAVLHSIPSEDGPAAKKQFFLGQFSKGPPA